MESRETGKPLKQLPGELETTARYFEYYAGLVNVNHGETINVGAGLAPVICGYVGQKIDFRYAFGLAGLFALESLIENPRDRGLFGRWVAFGLAALAAAGFKVRVLEGAES